MLQLERDPRQAAAAPRGAPAAEAQPSAHGPVGVGSNRTLTPCASANCGRTGEATTGAIAEDIGLSAAAVRDVVRDLYLLGT